MNLFENVLNRNVANTVSSCIAGKNVITSLRSIFRQSMKAQIKQIESGTMTAFYST